MTEQESLTQLRRVFVAFPSFREYANNGDGDDTIDAWANMLSYCDLRDVESIVDEILAGKREPVTRYQKPDMMPRNIASEARERRSRRAAVKNQQVKYHEALTDLRTDDQRLGRYWRDALWLGGEVRDKRLSKADNDDAMSLLSKWYRKGGEYPEAVADLMQAAAC